MWNLEIFKENKNFMMCLASLVFMFGILTFFNSYEILCCSIFSFIAILILFLKILNYKRVILLVLLFYFGFFISYVKVKNYDDLLPLTPANMNFAGRISSIPQQNSTGKVRFFMDIENADGNAIKGKTFVSVSDTVLNADKLNIGEKVKVEGYLRSPFKASNPSQFDYSKYLRNYNVFTVLYVNNGEIEFLNNSKSFKWKFLQTLNNTRHKILNIHEKYLYSPNLEILGGIVFGDDAVSPPEYVKNSFINSGLLHILAASGMNVAFIFFFWFHILQYLGVSYKPRVVSGVFVIILYTLMTGLGPSVVRAALMLIFVLIGKLIDRDSQSVSLLSLVAVLMLIYNPAYINDVSFQLSFLVTLGLITTANVISEKIPHLPGWFKGIFIIPIVAQIWVIPIQMFYFNTVSLYSVFANISTVSLLSVISFSGFLTSVLALLPNIGDKICLVFDFVNNYLLAMLMCVSDYFANLPHCIIQTVHPEIFQIVIYYLMIVFITYLIKISKYKNALISVLILTLLLCVSTFKPVSKNLEIITFDVGNADCFLIKTPQNKYFIIDTGKLAYQSSSSQAKIILLKYLKDRGIKNIEGLIVTHFDNDHAGGTVDIIENAKVKTLYLNSKTVDTNTSYNIFNASKRINQNIVIVNNKSQIYTEPDLKITNMKYNSNKKDADNESSIVTLLSYKNFDMLFMGDAGVETFENLKSNIPRNVEVLKVGHHGASNVVNNEMIDYLGTKVSVISTGLNHFGHPNKGTLDILRNTFIARTDVFNSIKISTDGEIYNLYSYNSDKKKYLLKANFNLQK